MPPTPSETAWIRAARLTNALITHRATATSAKAIQGTTATAATTATSAPSHQRALRPREDRDWSAGPAALAGAHLAVKDNFCTTLPKNSGPVFGDEYEEAVEVTACASAMLKGYRSPYEATVVRRWRGAGGLIVGKTNMDEFGMGSEGTFSIYGATHNPWHAILSGEGGDADFYSPGGSSSGSAAAVAARLVDGALGSDTGGSVRQPAAHCGVFGFKPTYGRLSRNGLVAFSSSLDTPGVLARSAAGCRALFAAADGVDNLDSTSSGPLDDAGLLRPAVARLAQHGHSSSSPADLPLAGITVGIPDEYGVGELEATVSSAWKQARQELESLGAKCVSVSLPHTTLALPAYYIIAPCEAASNLARYDGVEFGNRVATAPQDLSSTAELGVVSPAADSVVDDGDSLLDEAAIDSMMRRTRQEMFGPEVRRRILVGTMCLSRARQDSYYMEALRVRRLVANDFLKAFKSVDFLLGPTTPTSAKALAEVQARTNPVDAYLNDILTIPPSLAGLPCISVPYFPKDSKGKIRPVGIQLIGQHHSDYAVLSVAEKLRSETVMSPPAINAIEQASVARGFSCCR